MRRYPWILGTPLVLGALIAACSGGGSSSALSVQGKTVHWAPPQTFADNTPLIPSRDLQGFEIYIKQDPSFGAAESPVATTSPLDTKYNLATVSPPLSKGVTYYVSLRTVMVGGMKSDFSPAVSFSLP